MIRELISLMNLHVEFYKVKAHLGIEFNELADTLATNAHFDNTPLFEIVNQNQKQIYYVPRWRNITIDQHFRHFIVRISRNNGFEKWFNLFRNTKYRSLW